MGYLIEGIGLKKFYLVKQGLLKKNTFTVRAVDGINIAIQKGETLGLVGESGSGKTTLGKMLLRLIEPSCGKVLFNGTNILEMGIAEEEMRNLRRHMQIIFQDPDASLNPRQTLRKILSLPFRIHNPMNKQMLEIKILELLKRVEFEPPEQFMDRYPHELSGGQKQRVGIARAIALNPDLIVADEPVSSLDVSIRGQILKLMGKLQKEMNIAYLLITHDLAVVRAMGHRVAIMYVGKIVEFGSVERIFNNALHPYTQSLLLATPVPNPRVMQTRVTSPIKGEVPSPINPPSGCRFHPRCLHAESACSRIEPELLSLEEEHHVACHLASQGKTKPRSEEGKR